MERSDEDDDAMMDVDQQVTEKRPVVSVEPGRSVEGYVLLVTNVHEEATEEDIQDAFGDAGPIKNIHLNLDRRTGFVKGYCMIEFEHLSEGQDAINAMHQREMLGRNVSVSWAFSRPPRMSR